MQVLKFVCQAIAGQLSKWGPGRLVVQTHFKNMFSFYFSGPEFIDDVLDECDKNKNRILKKG